MVANLIVMAGADSVITLDLHSSQMQGFFKAPVDNLSVESSLARWIKENIPYWKEAVIVSKNASGAKRVTNLADMLKINFALIHVDSRRVRSYSRSSSISSASTDMAEERIGRDRQSTVISLIQLDVAPEGRSASRDTLVPTNTDNHPRTPAKHQSHIKKTASASDIHTARLISGHVLDEDYPSPTHLHRHLRQMASSSSSHTTPHSPTGSPTSEQNPFENGEQGENLSSTRHNDI